MEDVILKKLHEIEAEKGVKILYACESGSRAWGFPSPDSDYDVRFLYACDLDWHLSLRDRKDSIDLPINEELDINAWEIKKALGLLWKSNAALLEWLQSPIVYIHRPAFLNAIRDLADDCFSPIAAMHHYLTISKKYYEDCVGKSEIKLKRYFYALRTTIAGKWIRETGGRPKTEMVEMFDVIEEPVKERILELIKLKAGKNEDYLHHEEPLITKFLGETIAANEQIANALSSGKGNIDMLEAFYREVVKGNYHDA